jgi:hypothetical protein
MHPKPRLLSSQVQSKAIVHQREELLCISHISHVTVKWIVHGKAGLRERATFRRGGGGARKLGWAHEPPVDKLDRGVLFAQEGAK